MPEWTKSLSLAAVLAMWVTSQFVASPAQAADAPRQSLAATDELPAALRAVDVRPSEILTRPEAAQVRGEWILTLNLPYFATQLQGNQPFTLQLWTVGAGIAPGTPVYVRITVGR